MIRILKGISLILVLAGLFVLLGFMNKRYQQTPCRSFEVELGYLEGNKLVDKTEVRDAVFQVHDPLIGMPVSNVKINAIENLLLENAYIGKADVYANILGDLKIKVTQRSPLAKVIDSKFHHYYIDKNGMIFSNDAAKAARVVIVNGDISPLNLPEAKNKISIDSLNNDQWQNIYQLAKMIAKDDFLQAQIEQIYFVGDEIELIPKLGKHYIEFGNFDHAKEKLENLKAFYIKGLQKKDWNTYSKISLKFKNQIVCTKI